MSNPPMVPMYAPDGTLGDIPYSQMSAALRAGGKMGVNMTAPDGTQGVIPADRVQEAAKAGGKIIPYDLAGAKADKGTLDTFADDVKSVFSGLWESAKQQFKTGNAKEQLQAAIESQRASQAADEARKAAGYSLPYRVGAGIAEGVGTNVQGMEQAAKEGNSDAVVGHMLAGQALASAPLAVEGIGKVSSAISGKVAEYKPEIMSELGKTHSVTGRLAKMVAGKVLPGEEAPSAAETRAVPIRQSPNFDPGAYKAGAAERTTPAVAPSQIAKPETGAPETAVSEGRPATWTNERVVELATQGNRQAITQAVKRGFMLPENARYVMGDLNYPNLEYNPRSVTRFSETGEPLNEPRYAYRSRDIGEEGIPADQRSHAHATTDLEDLQRLAPGRASITGKGQEFVRADLSKMQEGKDYVVMHRPGQADWIRFLRPLKESELEVIGRHGGQE